jgi:shikimate dehydrogenase
VEKLRRPEYLGANVTIPHKERVGQMLDGTDSWAGRVGAVNTIVKEGRRLVGHNTDAYGFVRSLKDKAGFEIEDSHALLLGAGGAARAAAFGLAEEGIASLTIANRTLERARSLADSVRSLVPSVTAIPLEAAFLAEALPGADLIVNCTPMGMSSGATRELTPLHADAIPSTALVYDMVYAPPETPLLLEARKAGARCLGGLWMLVYQGAAAFELWIGRDAPVGVMFEAAKRAMAARHDV